MLKKSSSIQQITWIKHRVSIIRYSSIVNGNLRVFFGSLRGLRQGDPFSPMLLILVMGFIFVIILLINFEDIWLFYLVNLRGGAATSVVHFFPIYNRSSMSYKLVRKTSSKSRSLKFLSKEIWESFIFNPYYSSLGEYVLLLGHYLTVTLHLTCN